MAALETLIVEVQAQTGNLKSELNEVAKSIEKVGNTAKSEGTKVSGFGEQMKKGLHTAGLALGMLELVHIMKESTKVAAEDATSKVLLARQMQVSANATKEETAAVEENLAAMSRMSGVLEVDLRPSYAKLIRVTKDSAQALKLQQVALDASAAVGKPLASVTQALSRAYAGNTGALTKMFPELKNSKNMIHDLAVEMKGAAKAAADANPYTRLQATFEQIQVTLGEYLLPILSAFSDWLSNNAQIIQELIPVILALVAGFVAFKTATMLLNGAMALYDGAMALATIATEGFTVALASTGIGAIAIAVGVLTAAIIGLNGAMGQTPDDSWKVKNKAKAEAYAAQKLKDYYAAEKGMTYAQIKKHRENVDKPGQNIAAAYHSWVTSKETELDTASQTYLDNKKNAAQAALDKANALASGLTTTTASTTSSTDPVISYLKTTTEKIIAIKQKFSDAVVKANTDYANQIQSQIDEFRGAFAQATSTDIGSIFANGVQSADQLAAALKQRLQSIQQLAQDAASLSAAGYSKTFIEQVISQGPEMGDQMAQALLKGAPEVQKQIQDLFSQTQEASSTGVDQLAYNIQDQFTASTKALTSALDKAATTMSDALDRITTAMGDKLTKLGSKVKGHAADVAAVQASITAGQSDATSASVNAYQTSTGNPAVAGQSTAPTFQINTTANTNASPMQIAQSTVSAIKFNIPTWLPVGVN